ncbi:helix-turn-helix transcriptional regulator [bacterium]|nr:helix-turn-helix transcriptional regulator [bacterium]
MRPRAFVAGAPIAVADRRIGPFLVSLERYRGFFAEAHTHDEWQIQVPVAGRIHVTLANERHLAGPESVILMPPNVAHAALYLDGELDLLVVMAPPDWGAQLAAALGGAGPRMTGARVISEPFIWPLAARMASELREPRLGSDRVLAAAIELLGVALVRAYEREPVPAQGVDFEISRAIEMILKEYAQDLTIEELAQQAGMTPRHFDRRFKAATGVTPKRFLIDVRLRAARELLETTSLPVTRIALDVGFRQPSHFIRTFHQAIGQPPAAYRRQFQALVGS